MAVMQVFLTLGVPFDQAKATGNRRNSLRLQPLQSVNAAGLLSFSMN